jgi:hypothetical protein
VPSPSRRLRTVAFLAAGLVLAVAAIGYFTGGHRAAAPAPPPPGCQAGSGVAALPLDTSQAAIAATIAGVAARHGLGKQAVTIAYATALQESKLQNLDYGDRDSVGVFQQRPSQGWGTASELQDPVYATTRFFAALVKVPGYATMPVSQAAQDVQHSAGGYAYEQWAETAALLAGYFTGASAAGVSCWYTPSGPANVTGVLKQLTSTFGPSGSRAVLTRVGTARTASTGTPSAGTSSAGPAGTGTVGGDQQGTVTTEAVVHVQSKAGWTVASWLVANAQQYGLRQVRYAGYVWTAASGSGGWHRATSAPPTSESILAG